MKQAPVPVRDRRRPIASVIIPAFDEQAVIGRCLETLLGDAATGELDVIVVCNGCHDRTAAIARRYGPSVRVFETARPLKTHALNLGSAAARNFPRVFVDADVRLTTRSLRRLVAALNSSGRLLAAGGMDVDLSGCDALVRAFHRVWRHQPYFDGGKVGGVFALSEGGATRIMSFPDVTADDEFVRGSFRPDERVEAKGCRFVVDAPRTIASLIRVKGRVRRGTAEIRSARVGHSPPRLNTLSRFLGRIALRPWLWFCVPVYGYVVLASAIRARAHGPGLWERDLTTRSGVGVRG